MKITDMRVRVVAIPMNSQLRHNTGVHPGYLLRNIVEIFTDEGIVGLGECGGGDAKAALMKLKPRIIGLNPFDLETIKMKVLRSIYYMSNARLYGAIEIACLDIQGKVAGVPMHRLLGGALRDRIPMIAYLFWRYDRPGGGHDETAEDMADFCVELHETLGVNAMKLSNSVYKVMAVEVAQNSIISFSGIDNPLAWYVDPDHFEITAEGLKFKAVTGYYSFELNLAEQFVTVRRVKEDGKAATYADEGAITFMGWGVGHPYIASPLAWDNGHLITLAEVEDGVYQFTGVAGEATDTTMGVRWQYDSEVSFKFFGQAGWGDEWGTVTLTAEAQKYLGVYGNVELLKVDESGSARHPLEIGATYVMTVTNCTDLKSGKFDCTIDFKKL